MSKCELVLDGILSKGTRFRLLVSDKVGRSDILTIIRELELLWVDWPNGVPPVSRIDEGGTLEPEEPITKIGLSA